AVGPGPPPSPPPNIPLMEITPFGQAERCFHAALPIAGHPELQATGWFYRDATRSSLDCFNPPGRAATAPLTLGTQTPHPTAPALRASAAVGRIDAHLMRLPHTIELGSEREAGLQVVVVLRVDEEQRCRCPRHRARQPLLEQRVPLPRLRPWGKRHCGAVVSC